MCSWGHLFLCKLADGKGEGGVSLGELSLLSPVCHFLQAVCHHWGVMISSTWEPNRFPTLTISWSIPGLGSVAQDIECQLLLLHFLPFPALGLPLFRWGILPRIWKLQRFLPEKIYTHSSLLSGDFAVPNQGGGTQVKDPWHESYTGCFETGQFILLQSVLRIFCSLYCVTRFSIYFWNSGAQKWVSHSLRFISCSPLVYAEVTFISV